MVWWCECADLGVSHRQVAKSTYSPLELWMMITGASANTLFDPGGVLSLCIKAWLADESNSQSYNQIETSRKGQRRGCDMSKWLWDMTEISVWPKPRDIIVVLKNNLIQTTSDTHQHHLENKVLILTAPAVKALLALTAHHCSTQTTVNNHNRGSRREKSDTLSQHHVVMSSVRQKCFLWECPSWIWFKLFLLKLQNACSMLCQSCSTCAAPTCH